MDFHRGFRDAQVDRDLFVQPALDDLDQNRVLARRQYALLRANSAALASRIGAEQGPKIINRRGDSCWHGVVSKRAIQLARELEE
jgi:hypothetical protein